MINIRIIFSFSLLLSCFFSVAQEHEDPQILSFKETAKSLVVLKNDKALIPLNDLHEQKIAFVWVGYGQDGGLYQTLSKYMPIHQIQLPEAESKQDLDEWAANLKKTYSLVIIGIEDGNDLEAKPLYSKHVASIGMLTRACKTVGLVFGEGNVFFQLSAINAVDALVFTPNITGTSSSLAAQLVFGGIGTSTKLDMAIGPYEKGTGIEVEGGNRLRYSPPGLVGMDKQKLKEGIAEIVEEGLAAEAFPGVQVLVAKDGHVIYHEAFGYHTYDSLKPVLTTDIYDFASLTKVTSSLPALMKLHGEGQFDLDAPLKQYFPGLKKSNKSELTYRSMLAHNARLRPWVPYWRGTLKKNAKYPWKKKWSDTILNDGNFRTKTLQRDSSAEYPTRLTANLWQHRDFKEKHIYKAIRKSPLNEKPGYKYSGLLFYLLPEIVSDLTQSDFETYLNDNFYHRIGAHTLGYNPMRFFPLSRIIPTERDTFFRMQQLHGTVHDEGAAMMGGVSSNAGLFGSANDLAKLFQLYMNYGQYGGEQLIAEEAVKEFIRCQYCEEDNRRGLGFDKPLIEYNVDASSVAKDASPSSFGHSGYTGTFAWADPESGILFIFFSNRVFPTRDNPKIYRLGIRPRIHQVIYDAIIED